MLKSACPIRRMLKPITASQAKAVKTLYRWPVQAFPNVSHVVHHITCWIHVDVNDTFTVIMWLWWIPCNQGCWFKTSKKWSMSFHLCSLSLRYHAHGPSAERLINMAHKSGSSSDWMNEWCTYIALYCVLLYTQSALQSCGGGGGSLLNPHQCAAWCDGCHRTTVPVRSPHTSYRWRGERVIEPIKCMRSLHTSYRWRGERFIEPIKCIYAHHTPATGGEERES